MVLIRDTTLLKILTVMIREEIEKAFFTERILL